jgi:hypothetical protein
MHLNIEISPELAKQWRDYKHDHPEFKVKDWFERVLNQLFKEK